MKANALRIGKAMSAALFVLLLVVVGTKNALAQNLVATLQHGDDVSMYYGSNAFVQAHEAAQTGDIITLSSGTFNPTTITKAITMRGAGCCIDTITGIYPTVFNDELTADISDEEHSLTMEGICVNSSFSFGVLNNPRFIKCNFNYLHSTGNSSMMQNAQFVNCMVFYVSDFDNGSDVFASNTQFINSVVAHLGLENCTDGTHISFSNSIIWFPSSYGQIQGLSAINSIFYTSSYNQGYISNISTASSSFNNCISIRIANLFANATNSTNMSVGNFEEVFDTFNGNYYNIEFNDFIYERFVLNNDFATSFLGNDGTEIGIHGGIAPYNPRPNYMVLKQCNVANQSTIDNKLSVEIQVVSEGE